MWTFVTTRTGHGRSNVHNHWDQDEFIGAYHISEPIADNLDTHQYRHAGCVWSKGASASRISLLFCAHEWSIRCSNVYSKRSFVQIFTMLCSPLFRLLSETLLNMQVYFSYLFILSDLAISQAVTTASTLTLARETLNASSPSTRLLLGIPEPPPNFDVEYDIGGAKLKVTPCLMNTIAALKELALGDWQAKIVDGTEYRLESYPEVGIIVTTPRRKRNIQARFVIWAITLGVYDMIAMRKFEFAQFEMTWDREVIGWVHVVNHPPALGLTTIGGSESNGTMEFEKRLERPQASNGTMGTKVVSITNIVDTNYLADTEESRLALTFGDFGNILSIFDVFVPIIIGLSDLATNPGAYTAPGLIIALHGSRAGIYIFPVIPERTSPPFLEYQWLIRALTRIPEHMFQEHRFGEVNVKLNVDGVRVGWGRMSIVPCEPPAPAPSISSVAVSP